MAKNKSRPKKKPPRGKAYEDNELTAMQAAFVRHYCTHWKSTKAAIEAGYSEKTATAQGCQLLDLPKVQKAIEENIVKIEKRLEMRRLKIIEQLEKIAYSDITDITNFDSDGRPTMKPISEWPEGAKVAVQEISRVDTQFGGTTKFKMMSKKDALELLGKYHGHWRERIEHSGGLQVDATYSRLQSMPEEKRKERLEELRKQREQIEKNKKSVKLK